jgi:hypothetical protein
MAEAEAGQERVGWTDALAKAGALGALVADQLDIANLRFPRAAAQVLDLEVLLAPDVLGFAG